jgi:hypothetical protein
MRHHLAPTLLIGAAALAACTPAGDGGNTAAPVEEATASPAAGVMREEIAPTPTPSPAPLQVAVIQSQPGPRGNTVALNRVAVTGDILTVSLTFSGGGDCCIHIPVDDVSVIDDSTSQRISVLKDGSGKWMAAPLDSAGKTVGPESWQTPSVLWFKFPAPPATSKTVSITLPGVAPFDAVPVTR